ncbi:hypothetical protein HCA44_08875 [Rhodococcus sp. HNM0569]|nr:hypothetical protein [Rhodococcus sp. HNM0569]
MAGLVVAVLVSAGVAMFARGNGDAPARAESAPLSGATRDDVQSVLDRWAGAVRSGDTNALAALVDRSAAPGFLDAEQSRARNAAGVPFEAFGYALTDAGGTPVPDDLVAALGADEVIAPGVELRYSFAGADPVPATAPVSVVLARRGDVWTLVTDAPVAGRDVQTWRGPWDFGPVVAARAEDGESLVLGHPGDRATVEQIARGVDDAIARVTDLWGSGWSRRAVVVVAASQAEFTSLVGSEHDGANIAAVAVAGAVDRESRSASGQRIVFSPASRQRLDAGGRLVVLRHELMHAAARVDTVDGSPLWMLEGYAEYAAHRGDDTQARQIAPDLASRVADGMVPDRFPRDDDFSGSGSAAYEASWSLCAFVADTWGDARLTDLYRALAGGPRSDDDVEAVVERELDTDVETFLGQWRDWLARELG